MTGVARYLFPLVLALVLVACNGGSSSGAGTVNSPFVGTYKGSSAVTVSTAAGSKTLHQTIQVYLNPDGLVQVGDGEATIYASGYLHGNTVRIEDDAATVVDPACSGTVALTGTFTASNSGAAFAGQWSSSGASCFGVAGTVSGPVTATRVATYARATRVFQTNSSTLLRAFREATK